jgi:enoyl-CoA hydratase
MSLLLTELRDRVAVLTFNDPDRRNAISEALNAELDAAFDELEADEGVGAVVLTGAGRAFCAGAVLDDLVAAGSSGSPTPRSPRSPQSTAPPSGPA